MEYMKCNTPIAILLGVYNGEKYLSEQIDSLLNQTYKDWTLYIRDDASTDATVEIAKGYATRYDNIIVVEDELGNLGCNGNYFELLKKVQSRYYMFCNADDFWFPNKILLSINKMKEAELHYNDMPLIVHTDLSVGDANLNVLAASNWQLSHYNPERFKTYNYMGITCMCAGATLLFNTKARDNCFPEFTGKGLYFDHWLALQNVSKGKILTIYEPTLIYRQIGTNVVGLRNAEERSLKYKLMHLSKLWKIYIDSARVLKEIGWGGYPKYFWYKFLYVIKTTLITK